MKKIIMYMLAFIILISLTSCVNNSLEKDIAEGISEIMTDVKNPESLIVKKNWLFNVR